MRVWAENEPAVISEPECVEVNLCVSRDSSAVEDHGDVYLNDVRRVRWRIDVSKRRVRVTVEFCGVEHSVHCELGRRPEVPHGPIVVPLIMIESTTPCAAWRARLMDYWFL